MVARDPDDQTRRLFLPVKNNLALPGKGIAFRLEQRLVGEPDASVVSSSVVWDDHVETTADQALQAGDESVEAGGEPLVAVVGPGVCATGG